jgi:hypothetical protein
LPVQLLLACLLLSPGLRVFAQSPPSEYDVKAAYLLNFTKFVTWPAEAFGTPDAPLTICIYGHDPFGATLDEILANEAVGRRPVRARRLFGVPARGGCHILFMSSAQRDAASVARRFGPGVLTVGESDGFVEDGGMIQFVVENRRVRFDINRQAAGAATLQLSSQLLRVARSVR